jgi:hypothetical protein
VILFTFGVVKLVCAFLLIREENERVSTLISQHKNLMQHNYLSLTAALLGLLLVAISFFGIYASKQIEDCFSEDQNLQRMGYSKAFMASQVHLNLTFVAFSSFLYCSIWFIFFSHGPATWFENHYFEQSSSTPPKPEGKQSVGMMLQQYDFIERNIQWALVVLGLFCLFITYLLFVSIQLVKKIMRRMDRVNSVV